jgi:sugar/nucleoside kinase (ribokinase family)
MGTKNDSILTVGSIAIDTVKTPKGKVDGVLGGSCNYFSVAASFFNPVQVVGVVGKDFPTHHLTYLQERKIDISGIEVVEGKTFHWVGEYSGQMDCAITHSTSLNVFEYFRPVLSQRHRESTYVFLGNIDPELQMSVLEQNQAHRLVALDSMNFWITGKPKELREVLRRVDILSLNESEVKQLAEEDFLRSAAEKVLKMGPKALMVKRGSSGAILFTESSVFATPAYLVESVVDPTGAGDCFAGAFMGHLASRRVSRDWIHHSPHEWDKALRQAMVLGCVMASFVVEDFSLNRLKQLSKPMILERTSEFVRMTQVEAFSWATC